MDHVCNPTTMARHANPPPADDEASPSPKISDAEWTVMKVLWERGTSTLAEVVRDLEGRLHWKPRTGIL